MKKSSGIFKTLALIMSLVLLLMLAVQAVFIWEYRKVVEENTMSSLETVAQQAGISVGYELDGINTSAISSFRNPRMTDILIGREDSAEHGQQALSELMGLNRSIAASFLLDNSMNIVCSVLNSSADAAAVERVVRSAIESGSASEAAEQDRLYFSYLHPILYREQFELSPPGDNKDARQIGHILLICSLNSVEELIKSNDYDIIVRQNDLILASSLPEGAEAETDKYNSFDYSIGDGFAVTALAPKDLLRGHIIGMTAQMGLLLFAVTVAALGLAFVYLSRSLARPIKRMEKDLLLVSSSDSSHRLHDYPDNEIGQVSEKINLMLDRIEEARSSALAAQQEKYENEILLRKAELNYIHAQVKPHFLYNSLETVCGMAAAGRNDLVINTCTALSSLFRYSIRESDTVPLEEELRYARNYFYVMKHRHQGNLELEIEVDEDCRRTMVPKMILQPILENCLKHGELKQLEHGRVKINSVRQNNSLIISVRDNGIGIPPDRLEQLRRHIRADSEEKLSGHMGLRNLNARLHMHFGGSSGIGLCSSPHEGTEIKLVMELPE